jgi:hypothetical protein
MTRENLEEYTRQVVRYIRTQLESSEEKKEENLSDLMNRWIGNVRAYGNENQNNPFFHEKPRGYGQRDASTDGRLRRKLIMKLAEKYATDEPDINNNEELNKKVATRLGNFLPQLTSEISQPLKKALYLTAEKLRDPLGYKQKYARLVPFGNTGWVKASRRFANLLPLMKSPTISDLNQRLPPKRNTKLWTKQRRSEWEQERKGTDRGCWTRSDRRMFFAIRSILFATFCSERNV